MRTICADFISPEKEIEPTLSSQEAKQMDRTRPATSRPATPLVVSFQSALPGLLKPTGEEEVHSGFLKYENKCRQGLEDPLHISELLKPTLDFSILNVFNTC